MDSPAGNASLATTIYVSSNEAKAIGVSLIAISVVFAFCFTVVLRHRSNRKTLQIAPSVAREVVHALLASFGKLTPPMRTAALATETQLGNLLIALDVPALEQNGLPMSWAPERATAA